jgi:tetratricopeptide (TPR) repeat protein
MKQQRLDDRLGDAAALIAAGDFAQAKTLLAETTSIFSDSAKAWKSLGVVEDKLANDEAAERHLLKSLQLDDTDDDAWSVLGGLYFYEMARHDDALSCFRRSLAINPADTYALMNYLTVAAVIGEWESAFGEYGPKLAESEARCAVQIGQNVNVPWCHYDLGQILFFDGRYDECRSVIRAAFARSSAWQITSARLPYEQLTRIDRFAEPAHAVLNEFPAAGPAGGLT